MRECEGVKKGGNFCYAAEASPLKLEAWSLGLIQLVLLWWQSSRENSIGRRSGYKVDNEAEMKLLSILTSFILEIRRHEYGL